MVAKSSKKQSGPSLFSKIQRLLGKEKVSPDEIKQAESDVRRDPNSLRKKHKLADLYAKAEMTQKAIDAYISLAEEYVAREFYPQAVAVYKQILKINEKLLEVHRKLAELYNDIGRRSDAITQLQRLAAHYETSGALRMAGEVFQRIIEIDEDNIPMQIKLAELYLRVSENESAVYQFEKALRKIGEKEHWNDYIKVGERLLFIVPDHLHTLKMLARLYLDANDPMKSIGKLQHAFKLNRRDPDTLELLAIAFEKLSQPTKTMSVLQELADVYEEAGQHQHAYEVYQQLLEYEPDNTEYQECLQRTEGALDKSTPSKSKPKEHKEKALVSAPIAASDAAPVAASASAPVAASDAALASVSASKPKISSSSESSKSAEIAIHSEEIEKLLSDTEVYLKYGLIQRVEEALHKVFQVDPEHKKGRYFKAQLLICKEKFEEAATDLLDLSLDEEDEELKRQYIEKILELEGISPKIQEEAYQMSIQLRHISPSKEIDSTSNLTEDATSSEYEETPLSDQDEIFEQSIEDDVELDDVIDIQEQNSEKLAEDLELVGEALEEEDDIDIIDEDLLEIEEAEEINQYELTLVNVKALTDVLEKEKKQSADISSQVRGVAFIDPSGEIEIGDIEFISDSDDELEFQNKNGDVFSASDSDKAMTVPVMAGVSEIPSDEEPDSAFMSKVEPVVPFSYSTSPSIPPVFPSITPPQEAVIESDPFDLFLHRAENVSIEDEAESFDFLSKPIVFEPELPVTSDMPSVPVSIINQPVDDIEAAAARLEALIRAKESGEEEVQATEDSSKESLPIPPPFAFFSSVPASEEKEQTIIPPPPFSLSKPTPAPTPPPPAPSATSIFGGFRSNVPPPLFTYPSQSIEEKTTELSNISQPFSPFTAELPPPPFTLPIPPPVPITPPPPFHSLPVAEESRSAEQPNSEILTCDTSTDMNSWQDELDLKKSDELSAQVVSETDEAIYLAQRVMSPPVPLAEISEVDGESEISQTSESDETLSRAIPYISSDDPAQQAQAIFEQYDFSSAEAIASPIQDGSFESLEHSVPDRLDYEPPIVQEQLSTDSSSAEEISLEDEDIDEIEYFTDSTILDAFDESSTFANELEEALLYFEQEEYIYSLQIYREILARDPHHQIALQGERESLSAIEQKRIREEQERSSLDLDLDAALGSITPLSGTARRRATQDIQAFTDAVKSTIGEEEGDAHFDLGIAYQGMGLLSQAIDAFQLCLRNQYRPLDSYKMLGSCYCMQGNLEQALSSYQRALSLPDITHEQHLDILFDIGLAYEQYNQISQALKYYQEVALLEHNYREVQQKIQYLHSL